MGTVFVFPGQGSQFKGMGSGLFEKYPELVSEANSLLGYCIKDLCLSDPLELIGQTTYTQPAIYTVSVLEYLDRIDSGAKLPNYVAGHSLGEYTALFAAGVFNFSDGLRIVKERASLMSDAKPGSMAAVVGIDIDKVRTILDEDPFNAIDIANVNSREQCVISGLTEDIYSEALESRIEDEYGALIHLNVSGAFHSRLMEDTREKFSIYLSSFELQNPSIPVVFNSSARCVTQEDICELITSQITKPVQWYESISWLISINHKNFIEVGPGNVLTKINKTILENPMQI